MSYSNLKKRKDVTYGFVCGCLIIIVWFFLTPYSWRQEVVIFLRRFIDLPGYSLMGMMDLILLFIGCFLCRYPLPSYTINAISMLKQITGAVLLLAFFLFCSIFFVQYTDAYQETMPLFHFVLYQIVLIGFTEEVVFRGFLRWLLQQFISFDLLVIFLCSLIFSIAHIGTNAFSILQLLTSFIIGGVFVTLTMKLPAYFSIYNLAVIHGVFNVAILGFTTYMQFI